MVDEIIKYFAYTSLFPTNPPKASITVATG